MSCSSSGEVKNKAFLISYCLNNVSARNYKNLFMYVNVIASQCLSFFEDTVYMYM